MKDHIHYLKWFYTNSRITFSKRFITLSLLILTLLLYGLVLMVGVFDLPKVPLCGFILWLVLVLLAIFWGVGQLPSETHLLTRMKLSVDQLDFDTARILIEKVASTPFTTPTFSFRFKLLQAWFYTSSGEPVLAYKLYQELLKQPLLPQESCSLSSSLASLLFKQGDLKACRKEVIRLRSINGSIHEPLSLLLLESQLLERSDDINSAIEYLEEGLTNPNINKPYEALFFHQLALLESTKKNENSAISYYFRAWSILKDSHNFRQTNATVENLLMLYLKLDERQKAEGLLTEFTNIIDETKTNQLIALHNLTVNMARELGDRFFLKASYQEADNLVQKLNTQEQLVFELTGLRMCLNDGFTDFPVKLEKVIKTLIQSNLSGVEKFRAFKSITGTLRQAVGLYGQRNDWAAYNNWILIEWMRSQDYIDEILKKLPSSLFYAKEEWFKLQLESIKLNLTLFQDGIPKAVFKKLFDLLSELKRIASDKENDQIKVHTLVMIIDEYISYGDQLKNEHFLDDFKALALESLNELESVMLKKQDQPNFHQYMVALGYFYSQLGIKQNRASYWINLFDSKELSLNHYPDWFRRQYITAQQYANLTK